MKTHLPTGLRKALIAAIFAVSAVAYNAQAATEYNVDTTVDAIDTTQASSLDKRSVSIGGGVTVTTEKGGVIANGITVGEYATLNSKAEVATKSDGNITVQRGAQVTVEVGAIKADGDFTASDHTTLTTKDGGITGDDVTISDYSTATLNGHVEANGVLTIDDNTKVNVKNGHITSTSSMVISNESQVTVKNGYVATDSQLTVSSTVASTKPHLSVTGGDITAESAVVTNANVKTDGKLVMTNGGLNLDDKATVTATEAITVAEGTVRVIDGSLLKTEGAITVTGLHKEVNTLGGTVEAASLTAQGNVFVDHSEITGAGGSLTVTGAVISEEGGVMVGNNSTLKADTVEAALVIDVRNGGDLTADTLIQAGHDLKVVNGGSIKGTADIIAMGGTDEHDNKDITIEDSTVEGASLTSVKGNITIKTTDETLAALEEHPELITSAVELTGDMKAEVGSITITKSDVNVGGKVVADKGLKVEGIEVTDEETTGNTLQTGDIIVANKVALEDTKKSIHDTINGIGTTDGKKNTIKNTVTNLANHLKGVDIANVAEGSAVGEVTSVGDITIKGSTLTAGSLTADATEMGAAIIEAAHEGNYGDLFEKELAAKLPYAQITVENSDVTVEGDVFSESFLTVTESDFASGDIVADGGVTIKGAPKVEVDGEMLDNRNTIATGDITVENNYVLGNVVDAITAAKDMVDGTIITDDDALDALVAMSDQLVDAFGDVSIENVRKSTVGDVETTGNIVIKGSKLTADSLTADAAEVRETINTVLQQKFGDNGVEKLADKLPTVSIAVEDSKVNVKGEVTSDTTIDVKNGYLKAKGDVTANDGNITAEDADLASDDMTAAHGAITVTGGSLNAKGDVTADAGLSVSGNEEGTSTLTAKSITVENKDAIADAKDTIAEMADKIDGLTFTKDDAIAELQTEVLVINGVTIKDMAEGSSAGAVSTNGNISIAGSTMQADSLTADSTAAREDIIATITGALGDDAVEALTNLQPDKSLISVKESDVAVTGDVYSETAIYVDGSDTGASLLAEGTVTAADGNILATNADLASGDMIAEHGRVSVTGGSLDATGDVVADGGLYVEGNEEGTSSLNAASITVENNDTIAKVQDRIVEIKEDATIMDKETEVLNAVGAMSLTVTGVDVKNVASGTVGDVDAAGHGIHIVGSTLTTGSLTADATELREAVAGTIESEFSTTLAEQMEELMPVANITVTESTVTVEGDVFSESTITTTDSVVEVAGDVAAAETITVEGGKLIAEGAVTAAEDVTVDAATLQAQTITAETLVINDGEEVKSKVKVEDTITADIAGNGGVITSTGTEGKGLTIVGDVESTGVAIRTPQGGDIVIGDVTNTIPGVGNITGKQNEVTVKGDGDISVMGDITGAENALKVTGNGGISVNGTISGNSNTLTTKGEGDIYVNKIHGTKETTVTAANGDITIDTLSNHNKQMTVTSKKGGVTVTNDSVTLLSESAITAKKDITIGDAEVASANWVTLSGGTTVTSTTGDITLNQKIEASGEGTAITATKGTVTFTGVQNELGNLATVTADTIEVAEGADLALGENSADALQGKLSGTGQISVGADNLNRNFDDTAFNGKIAVYERTLTIADKGVGADATIKLEQGAGINETSTGASLGNVVALSGSAVTINDGTIDDATTATSLYMGTNTTLNIDASADSADLITVTKSLTMAKDHTVRVNAQESLESIEGDVRHTIIQLAEGAVNEGVSEEAKYDLVGGQRKLQGKNINLVNAGDHVDLVISTNYRGTEKTKPNQTAVNAPLKELSAEVNHNPGVLASMDSDLAHVLDALDNTRSEAATLDALQSLSAAGNLVVTNMMMDSSRNHLSTLRSHMGAPVCEGTAKGGNMWAAYTGGHDFIGADEYTGDYTRQHQGAIIGTDYSLSCNTSVGISLGYEHSIGHQDSVRADADTMFADLYATVKTGALTQRFSAGVALHDIDTKRHTFVSAAAHTYTGNSTGSMDALSVNLGYEVSYDVKLGKASTLTPFASVDVAIHQMDTLNEKGQGDASVITEYDEPVQVDVALGAAYTHTFASGAALSAFAAIHGELSENQPEATNRFAGAGRSWTTKSAERAPIYGEIGASVVLPVSTSTSLIGGGNFEFSDDRISVGGNVGVNVKF